MERKEWLEARKNGIGGSDAATIMGCNPWSSPYALFLDKMGLAGEQADNERMLWGRKLEPLVADHYAEVTGRSLVPGVEMLTHPERPHLFANTDRMISPCPEHSDKGVYEGKTTSAYNKDEWKDGRVPLYYQVQVQHYLYVNQATWGSLAVLVGGQEFVWQDVERNDRFLEAYLKKADEFWERVQSNDPPPMEGHEAERRAITSIYPSHEDGKTIELPGDAEDWRARMEEARIAEKDAEKEKKKYDTMIRGAMGDAMFGRLPDGSGFKLAVEHKKEHTRKASSSRVLRKLKRVA